MGRLIFGLFAPPLLLLEIAVLRGHPLTAWVLVNTAVFPLILAVSIALHEAGHAIAARLLGLEVPRIELGQGRRLRQWRWGRTTLALNSLPSAGITYLAGTGVRGVRGRLWLTIAAGPLITAALWGAALHGNPSPSVGEGLFPTWAFTRELAVWEVVAFVNGWLLAFNLVPLPALKWLPLGKNDGARLLTVPFAPQRELDAMAVTTAVLEAEDLRGSGDLPGAWRVLEAALSRAPGSWVVRNSLAIVQLQRGELVAARELFLELFAEEPPAPELRWLIRSNLAWADFRIRSDELRGEADTHSAAAHARLPRTPSVLGTRGAVLVWLGRAAEAVPLLERAYAMNSDPLGRALNACCLVLAATSRGRLDAAQLWLARARENHLASELLPEAETAVEALARGAREERVLSTAG
ncbi:M50 family metallopeptidase [Stigmatella sp. ncwal1]|uniref:M50 family metallopeptidase n=1 Tax=Stigmatella ashevillensis TaxID=2995309 RepID=A0ABT5DHK5_9BACT|nr:M50 family metallopeptidase [Stigmatella ashevillena]MDC0713144.1 M50 family metallopeptidase [Stigmatella ashevillena]